ncbi:hypothetical protein PBAL39_17224 [Pedobacter sp. BAL39]|nr:hypothetical protein PBAL39_17224 [Pedobacter sp. BAL39]
MLNIMISDYISCMQQVQTILKIIS